MNNIIQELIFTHQNELPAEDKSRLQKLISDDNCYEAQLWDMEQKKQKVVHQQFCVWMEIIKLFQKHNI